MIDQSCLAKTDDDMNEDVRRGLRNEDDIKAKKEEHLAFLQAAKAEKDKAGSFNSYFQFLTNKKIIFSTF